MEHDFGKPEILSYAAPVEPSWVPRGPMIPTVRYTCKTCGYKVTGSGSTTFFQLTNAPSCPAKNLTLEEFKIKWTGEFGGDK